MKDKPVPPCQAGERRWLLQEGLLAYTELNVRKLPVLPANFTPFHSYTPFKLTHRASFYNEAQIQTRTLHF